MVPVSDPTDHSRFTIDDSRSRARRLCVVLAVASASWSLSAFLTGGVSVQIGFIPLSSRNPRNPALIATFALIAACALSQRGERLQRIRLDLQWMLAVARARLTWLWATWTRLTATLDTRLPTVVAPLCAVAIALAIVVTSVRETAFVAAGSDASGYVTQAEMWATATLTVPEPLMVVLDGLLPREAMAPLAYRPSQDGAAIVPVTSPGLPMLMALFQIAGGRSAVFATVPLLAAVAIWATYLLGRTVGTPWTGVIAAALLASSPAFLFQLTSSPMSDIPAAAFWTLSLVSALGGRGLPSGVAAGIAVLIRANLAPVAIVPATILFVHGTGRASATAADRLHETWRFIAGVVPAALLIAALYTYWYGSPLNSGYGTLEQLYSVANLWPNLTRYSRWLLESQTAVVLLGLVAFARGQRRRAAAGLGGFILAVLACYVFYFPFDAWWFLRFLLPAFPALLVLTAAGLLAVSRWLPPALRAVTVIGVLVAVVNQTVGYAQARATFDTGGEQKYALTGRYVADHLPGNAVVFSEIYSGSIRYYSGRPTIRFGRVPSDHLEGAVAGLLRHGYQPYLIVEDWEEDLFRAQFGGRGILSLLADGPQAELPLGHVRVYPLAR